MRSLQKIIAELRWGPLETRRKRGLVYLHDVLAETSFGDKYWVIMGLLLGCMRDGEPIAWDRDADFAFHKRDLPAFNNALTVLRSHGFNLRPMQINNDGSITKWAVKRQGMKYEFFLIDEHEGRYRWLYHTRKAGLEIVNEIDVHGLDEFELYGRRWLKPTNTDEYLTALYGNWHKPDPDYVYWRDCNVSVDKQPWAGKRRRP